MYLLCLADEVRPVETVVVVPPVGREVVMQLHAVLGSVRVGRVAHVPVGVGERLAAVQPHPLTLREQVVTARPHVRVGA